MACIQQGLERSTLCPRSDGLLSNEIPFRHPFPLSLLMPHFSFFPSCFFAPSFALVSLFLLRPPVLISTPAVPIVSSGTGSPSAFSLSFVFFLRCTNFLCSRSSFSFLFCLPGRSSDSCPPIAVPMAMNQLAWAPSSSSFPCLNLKC